MDALVLMARSHRLKELTATNTCSRGALLVKSLRSKTHARRNRTTLTSRVIYTTLLTCTGTGRVTAMDPTRLTK